MAEAAPHYPYARGPRRGNRRWTLVVSRPGVIVLGLAGLAFFAVLCVAKNAALIHEDIYARASIALSDADMGWADVAVDGRDVTLSGVAPSEEARAAAARAAAVWGVRRLNNELVALTAAPAVAAPYELAFVFDGTILSVEGSVPSAEAAAQLRLAAIQRFTAHHFRETLDPLPAGPAQWVEAAIAVLPLLAALNEGVAVLREGSLSLKGTVADAAAVSRLQEALTTSLPPGYEGIAALSVAAAGRASTAAASCQRRFNALLSQSHIGFETGEATIDPDSHALLDELALVAASCPSARIEIAGHTDDVGTRRDNLSLSQQRAESVMAYLSDRGIPMRRLTARGYGEERPLMDNTSAEGRTRNRRIELIVPEGR